MGNRRKLFFYQFIKQRKVSRTCFNFWHN